MQEVEALLQEIQKMQDERDQARQQVRVDRRQAEQACLCPVKQLVPHLTHARW